MELRDPDSSLSSYGKRSADEVWSAPYDLRRVSDGVKKLEEGSFGNPFLDNNRRGKMTILCLRVSPLH